jgi:hypothetical protein
MEIYKRFLILIIIILFFYIVYRLLKKINCCKKKNVEGLENLNATNEDIELNKLKSSEDVTIQSLHQSDTNLPLSQYVIKASYNTAVTGKYVNTNMIKYVLSRGCRFLDFEIFLIDGKPQVAFTNDSTYKTIQSKNNILLDDVLSTIVSNAFSNICPNRNDPLFINLRIKSSTSSNDTIYKSVAKSLYIIKESLYSGRPWYWITLSQIMGKIVTLVDGTINYDYLQYTNCKKDETNCYDLKKYTTIQSGTNQMGIERYSDILNKQYTPPRIINNIFTDVRYFTLALPDYDVKNTQNPSLIHFVSDYGIQIITYRYYIKDNNLQESENIFNENKYGIVPLATMLKYFEKKKEEASN